MKPIIQVHYCVVPQREFNGKSIGAEVLKIQPTSQSISIFSASIDPNFVHKYEKLS